MREVTPGPMHFVDLENGDTQRRCSVAVVVDSVEAACCGASVSRANDVTMPLLDVVDTQKKFKKCLVAARTVVTFYYTKRFGLGFSGCDSSWKAAKCRCARSIRNGGGERGRRGNVVQKKKSWKDGQTILLERKMGTQMVGSSGRNEKE